MLNESSPVIGHVVQRLDRPHGRVPMELVRRSDNGVRHVLLCLEGIGPFEEQLLDEGAAVVDLHHVPGLESATTRRLRREVRAHGIGVLHAHGEKAFTIAAMSRLMSLSTQPQILWSQHEPLRVRGRLSVRLLLRRRDELVAPTTPLAIDLARTAEAPDGRVEVIYPGLACQNFLDAGFQPQARHRRTLGLPAHGPILVQVGPFDDHSDHRPAIRAFASVARRLPEARLLLLGEGPHRPAAQDLAEQLGLRHRVRFLGLRADIPRVVAAADLCLVTHRRDGLPTEALEAMACARPVVGFATPGLQQVVTPQDTGVLAYPDDELGLARQLTSILEDNPDRWRAMGERGRDQLLRRFTLARMAGRYEQLYERMLRRSTFANAERPAGLRTRPAPTVTSIA